MMQRSAAHWVSIVGLSLAFLATMPLAAQPPDLPDLPADLSPPQFDLGTSAEAKAEQAKTQDQPTVVRTPKSVDFDRLVANLSLFALSIYIGATLGAKVRLGFHPVFLAGASTIAGLILIGALVTGARIAAGTSKAHPILLAALGFVAILLATLHFAGAFLLTRKTLLGEKREDQ